MLVPNQLIEIKWRKDNKEWYESKGYQYTKTSDTFFVKAEDLMYGSDQKVKVQCDYCGDIFETINHEYTNSIKTTKKCACNKPECKGQKISETKKAKELNARKELLDLFYQKCEQMGYIPITTIDEFQHARSSVSFECPKHGVVTISSVKYFLNSKYGCPECGREHIGENQGLSIDEVIAIVENKNGDKIKNPEEYKTARTKNLIITCGKCGKDFLSSLMNIQEGSGQCSECAHKDTQKNLKRSKDELISAIESKNNNKIKNPDDYVNAYTNNLIIICGQCGNEFTTSFASIANSSGSCPECAISSMKEKTRLSKEEVSALVASKNNDELLNPEDYINSMSKNLLIKCGSCGDIFVSSLSSIENSKGQCKKCGVIDGTANLRLSEEELIQRSSEISDSVLLNPQDYINNTTNNLQFRCTCGNIFTTSWATYSNNGKTRCGTCARSISSFERKVMDFLEFCNIKYEYNKTFDDCRDILYLPFDFYLPEYNTIIETDGQQHYDPIFGEKSFLQTVLHDGMKNNYCKWNNINLIRIPYWDGDKINRILSKQLGINYGKYFQQIEYIPTAIRRKIKNQKEEIA